MPDDHEGLTGGEIAGIAIGVVTLTFAAGACLYQICHNHRQRSWRIVHRFTGGLVPLPATLQNDLAGNNIPMTPIQMQNIVTQHNMRNLDRHPRGEGEVDIELASGPLDENQATGRQQPDVDRNDPEDGGSGGGGTDGGRRNHRDRGGRDGGSNSSGQGGGRSSGDSGSSNGSGYQTAPETVSRRVDSSAEAVRNTVSKLQAALRECERKGYIVSQRRGQDRPSVANPYRQSKPDQSGRGRSDRQSERPSDRPSGRYSDRQLKHQSEHQSERESDRRSHPHSGRQLKHQSDRQSERQSERRSDRHSVGHRVAYQCSHHYD